MLRRSPFVIFSVLAISLVSLTMLQSLVVPVLPELQEQFHTTPNVITWALTAWLLSAAVATPILGKIGDMFGKRRTLLTVLAALAAGSLISAVAPTIGVLLVGRVLQGFGGAMFPLAFGIIRDNLPAARVPGAIGALSAVIAIGSGLGTVLAGPIESAFGWQWLFWIPMIATLVGSVLAAIVVPESVSRAGGRINWGAAALLSGWLLALLLPLSEGATWGWGSLLVVGLFVAAGVLLAAWIVVEVRSQNPLIDMRIMRLPGVWTVNLAALFVGAGMFGIFAFFPRFAQTPTAAGYGFGATIGESGLLMVPMLVTMAVAGFISGPIARRIGYTAQLSGGAALIALSALGFAFLHDTTFEISIAAGVSGLGLGIAYAAMTSLIVQAVPSSQTGVASGMNANIRTIGGALGSTVMAAIVTSSLEPSGLPQESGYTDGYLVLAIIALGAVLAGAILPLLRRMPPEPGADVPTDEVIVESPLFEAA
ncbi:MFS transporter [Lysinimonas soli]|uniref:MFS transporter n=1 Tax=Lysinimonas soli TaxID=1074233 RepID=A0ABW0NNY2_9MICO